MTPAWRLMLAAAAPIPALAHAPPGLDGNDFWGRWDLSPEVSLPLIAAASLYGVGVLRLWRRAGAGRGISRRRASAFAAGIVVLALALVSPLDSATSEAFWIHMIQHLLLIAIAPPLLVAGAADAAFLWALPIPWRRAYGRSTRAFAAWLTGTGAAGSKHLLIVALATGVLWLWHIPALYDLAIQSEPVHFAEHVSFLVTAILFWMTILRLRPAPHAANGLRILSVFAMALQGAMLGALITFAAGPLYVSYESGPGPSGLEPLADQQLAGLIMWIPPGLLYAGVAAYLFVRWLEAVSARNGAVRSPQQHTVRPPAGSAASDPS